MRDQRRERNEEESGWWRVRRHCCETKEGVQDAGCGEILEGGGENEVTCGRGGRSGRVAERRGWGRYEEGSTDKEEGTYRKAGGRGEWRRK